MLIYNREWLDNLEIQGMSASWLKKKHITKEEHLAILQQYKCGYHQPNVFARIGMFLFTLVIVFSAVLLFNLTAFSPNALGSSIQCLFFGGVYYFVLEQ